MDDSMIGKWLSELPMDDPTRKSTSKPMLRRFIDHDKPVQVKEVIARGTEGIVCLVVIEGNQYVMKVFFEWTYRGSPFLRLREKHQPYTFPFSHESRAFARLDSIGKNGTFAVKCHGWMKLSDEQFRPFSKSSRNYSRWAIIKDYIPEPLTKADLPAIREKALIARKALLNPRDLKPENYRGSFLVDLGEVLTYPYPKKLWSNSLRMERFDLFEYRTSFWELPDGSEALDSSHKAPQDTSGEPETEAARPQRESDS